MGDAPARPGGRSTGGREEGGLLAPLEGSLRGKVALVTGASSGIGRVFACYLVQQGCHVAAAARRTAQLQELAEEVQRLRERPRDPTSGPCPGPPASACHSPKTAPASAPHCSDCAPASASHGPQRCCRNSQGCTGGTNCCGSQGRTGSTSCCCSKGCQGAQGCAASTNRPSAGSPGTGATCCGGASCDGHGCALGRLLTVELDVTGPEAAIESAVGRIWDHFGGINVVVNNAGYRGSKAGVLDIDDADFMRTLATNVRGPWVVAKAVVRRIVAAKKSTASAGEPSDRETRIAPCPSQCPRHGPPSLENPSVVNIASTAGLEGALLPNGAAYSSSKAAVIRLTKAMAIELGEHGVRCNAIAPGIFESDITQRLLQKEWMGRNARVVVPLQRWGSTHPDLTAALHYFAADYSRHVTGSCLVVDGGHSLMRMRLDPRL